MYKEYLNNLIISDNFLDKYLESKALLRLKKVGYFCGMDYASKDIYDFPEYISRFDHSLDVALLTYRFTNNKKEAIAGLIHDISTPCFSHVIDYMNKDYSTQESTEEKTSDIVRSDKYLLNCLNEDKIDVDEVINFKKYSIVDNNRPKLCADRLDGVILTGMFWTKELNILDVKRILDSLDIYLNEDNEKEIGFNNLEIAKKIIDVSNNIDRFCHSKEDNYMMELLANLTKYIIDNKYLHYEDLYYLNEEEVHKIFSSVKDSKFQDKYNLFKNISKDNIKDIEMPYIKKRDLNPLVNGRRII